MSTSLFISRHHCAWLILAILALPGLGVFADDSVSSAPMGYVKLHLQGRTDNLINIPLLQEAVGIGPVLTATAHSVSLDNINWTPDQFAPATSSPGLSYYAEISTGQLKGLSYPIVSNTADTLVLNTGTATLTSHPLGAVAAHDMVRIRPYWTIGNVFGATDTTVSVTPFSSLPTLPQIDSGDSLLLFDPLAIGLEKPPIARYAYVQSTGWRSPGDATTNQANVVLPPLSPVLVRLHEETGQELVIVGDAFQVPFRLYVPGGTSQLANDAYLALARSEPVSLADSGLYQTGTVNVVTATTAADQRQDLLLAFDPERIGFERPPEHTYFYLTGQGWREAGSSSTTVGADVQLDPTRIYILRKRANSAGQYWLQNGGTP